MTKAEIIAELRRSARDEENPAGDMLEPAWRESLRWKDREQNEYYDRLSFDDMRTFFLLVAHALEDE